MLRAYDTSQLFREDTLLRVQYISDEIEAIQKSIDRVEREVVSIVSLRGTSIRRGMGFLP